MSVANFVLLIAGGVVLAWAALKLQQVGSSVGRIERELFDGDSGEATADQPAAKD